MPTTYLYSVGFAFDEQGKNVVLIRKNHPKWQRGLLNGVGGHIEMDESSHAAQAREFKEETGVETHESNWNLFSVLHGKDYILHCFSIFTNEIFYVKTTTDEDISIYPVTDLRILTTIPNLQWLIPAALDQHFNNSSLCIREGNNFMLHSKD